MRVVFFEAADSVRERCVCVCVCTYVSMLLAK